MGAVWKLTNIYILFPPVIYCFVYYLWVGHNYCYAYLAGFTALFLLPGERRHRSVHLFVKTLL